MRSNTTTDRQGRMLRAVALAAVLGVLLAGTTGTWAQGAETGRVDKRSTRSFKDTLKKLETALKAEGMMIVAKIDHRNMLSMVGAKIGGATTVEFGKPDMGKMLLPMNPAIGVEMPAKIYVYEAPGGEVFVSYRKVGAQYASYGSPEVAKAGEMMDMMLEKFATAATE